MLILGFKGQRFNKSSQIKQVMTNDKKEWYILLLELLEHAKTGHTTTLKANICNLGGGGFQRKVSSYNIEF